MSKKWTYEKVKNYIEIESESSCRLLSDEYINIKTKMLLKCKCGNTFKTSLDEFKNMNKRQCNECGYNITKEKVSLNYNDVKKFIEIDSNSGCTLLSPSYINAHQKLKIRCSCGSLFETNLNNFKSNGKRQCNDCGLKILQEKFKLDYKDVKHFIEIESQSECKLLSKEYKNNNTKLKLLCSCGEKFWTSFTEFKDLNKRQCNKCSNSESKGEQAIKKYLENKNIKHIPQYTFDDCRNINSLQFDFYLPNYNLLIEYDGKQHFEPIEFFGGQTYFEYIKQNDNIKNEYCENNNIPLLRIPYWEFDNIENILNREILKSLICQ